MLDLAPANLDPDMLAAFPHRKTRRRKGWIGERAERDGQQPVELALDSVMHGRATVRAKVVDDSVAAVGDVLEGPGTALDRDLIGRPASLR